MDKNNINNNKVLDLLFNRNFCIIIIIVGIIIKISLFPFKLGDYNFYFEPWIEFIKSNGYMYSLQTKFFGQPPLYIYFLIAIAKLGFNSLYSIKILSIFFEYIIAYFIGKILTIKHKNNAYIWISLAIVPILPTVLINGAFWGQFDSIYAAFVIASIYYVLIERKILSMVLLGLSFAIKLQPIFILPFYFILLLRRKINWYYFLLVPIVYFLTLIPAWFFGRNILDLIFLYFNQSNYLEMLTIYFPNIYIFISNDYYWPIKAIGTILTILITLFISLRLKREKIIFTLDLYLKLILLSVVIVPFILPVMHERYLYLADVLAVLYYFAFRKNMQLSIGILLVSFYSYLCCSRLKDILPLWPGFILYSFVIFFLIKDFIYTLNQHRTTN